MATLGNPRCQFTMLGKLILMVLALGVSLLPGNSTVLQAAGPNCTVDPGGGGDYTTIQDAVNDSGCVTIDVMAGTYVEQVEIDRPVTIQGAGSSTIVQSPNTLTKYFMTSKKNYPIVYIHDTDGVTIRQLVVDGAGKGNANYRFQGIGFHNAGGSVENVEIKDVRDTPFSGAQHGVALYVYNEDGIPRSIAVHESSFHGFQKNALALNASPNTPLMVDVGDNQIVGAGPTNVTAQNGIQVWANQGTGSIIGNSITGIAYDNSASAIKWVAASILNYYASLDILGNTVSDGHVGIYSYDGSGQILGNDLSIKKVGDFAYGIIATDPPTAVPAPFGDETAAATRAANRTASTLNVLIDGNTVQFDGSDNSSTFGMEADAGFGADDVAVTATNNLVTGFEYGMVFYACQGSSCGSGVFTNAVANCNQIESNVVGMWSNVATPTIQGERNWWGHPSGPSGMGPGLGDPVDGNIDFTPWNTDRSCTATASSSTIIVVKPSAMHGWGFFEEIPNGSGQFVAGPASAPLGAGSAELTVDSTGRELLGTLAYAGTRLDQIGGLRYSSYRSAGSNPLALSLQFDVDYDVTDANTSWQGRLVFEPYYSFTVMGNTWQTWNALAGKWWATGSPGNTLCPISSPCPWTDILAYWPNAGIRANGALFFKAGGPWPSGFTGNVDDFTIVVAGAATTYDFEPEATAIELISFSAAAQDNKVVLQWQTGTEIDNAGFNLYRADVARQQWTQVNSSLIDARGSEVQGAAYEFVDAPGNGLFYYMLEDVDRNGVATRHGPVSIFVGGPQRTFLPAIQR